MTGVGVVADLAFSVTIPDGSTGAPGTTGTTGATGTHVSGRVRGEGSRLVISTGDAGALVRAAQLGAAGPFAAVRSVRRCAAALAGEGLSLSLVGARGTILELGKSPNGDSAQPGKRGRRANIRLGRFRDGYPRFVLTSLVSLTAQRLRRR